MHSKMSIAIAKFLLLRFVSLLVSQTISITIFTTGILIKMIVTNISPTERGAVFCPEQVDTAVADSFADTAVADNFAGNFADTVPDKVVHSSAVLLPD